MTRISKIVLCMVVGFLVTKWISAKYLDPIEKRVEAMADAAQGLDPAPPDIEKVCGVLSPELPPDQLEQRTACYTRETQKQIDGLNKVLAAGKLPTLGGTEPCAPELFQSIGDDGAGSNFLSALTEKDTARAYAMLSADMRAKVSEADLIAYVDKMLWRGHTIAGAKQFGSGSVSGGYKCEGKTLIPETQYEFSLNETIAVKAAVETVQEGSAWKIRAITVKHGSNTTDVKDAPLPNAKQLAEMASGAMHAFIVDTSGSKIDLLYSGTSMMLRANTSRDAISAKFKPYFGKFDFMAIENKPVTITSAPSLVKMEDGWPVIEVSGLQPTTGETINFKAKFAYDGYWQFAGLDVTTAPK